MKQSVGDEKILDRNLSVLKSICVHLLQPWELSQTGP